MGDSFFEFSADYRETRYKSSTFASEEDHAW